MPAALRKSVEVLLAAHAGIAHEDAAVQLPAAQIVLHAIDGGYIRCVAGKDPALHGKAVTGHTETNHHLGVVSSTVLAVATLPQVVLFVDLEVHAGSVVEDQIHIEVQEISQLPVKRFLDLLLGLSSKSIDLYR